MVDEPKRPDYTIAIVRNWVVKNGKIEQLDKGRWTNDVGVGFKNKDGSINLYLSFMPEGATLVVKEPRERETPEE